MASVIDCEVKQFNPSMSVYIICGTKKSNQTFGTPHLSVDIILLSDECFFALGSISHRFSSGY